MFKYNKIHTLRLNIIFGVTLLLITSCIGQSKYSCGGVSSSGQSITIPGNRLLYNLGIGFLQEKEINKAAECIQKSAEQGYAIAQNHFGIMLAIGEGVKQDTVKAKEWYQKAADQGNLDAKSNLKYLENLPPPIPHERLEPRKDMTAKEQQDYNKALTEIERAARTGGLTSTNSEDQRLIKSYTNNLKKLDAIKKEKVDAQKKVDFYAKRLAYAKKYPDIIDRDANRLIAEAIIARHPELRNIHLFRQWMITHRAEADAIAKPILANYDAFSTPHAKAAGF